MVEFRTSPYHPMDREYHGAFQETRETVTVEDPIIPMKKLGQTVVETDPRGKFGNIVQGIQAAIRGGAGTLQLVMTTPPGSPMGGRPKAYGEEVREALREVMRVNDVTLEGLEMPTAMSNLSGWDAQQGTFSDEKRREDLNEVRDAIKFVGDVAKGGGVDIFSVEFQRPMAVADWNTKGKWANSFELFDEEEKKATMPIVDTRTGRIIMGVKKDQVVFRPKWLEATKSYTDSKGQQVNPEDYIDYEGNKVAFDNRVPEWDSNKQEFVVERRDWDYFVDEAAERNRVKEQEEGRPLHPDEIITPEEAFITAQLEGQAGTARAWAMNYSRDVDETQKALKTALRASDLANKSTLTPQDIEDINQMRAAVHIAPFKEADLLANPRLAEANLDEIQRKARRRMQESREMSISQQQTAKETEHQMESVKSMSRYAKEKSISSYAEAGMMAYEESHTNPHVLKGGRDIFVGPENGWPTGWGSHPEEFIELIKSARAKLADELHDKKGFTREAAKIEAKKHVKGLFDTSHLGMFLRHFKPKNEQGELITNEAEKKKKFDKWYMEMVDKMAKEDVIGSVQAVDSASGAHGHLPPGQGILPVVDAVKKLKDHGFEGFVISEGHEEEVYGEGRILTKTWEAFGTPIGSSAYGVPSGGGAPQAFGQIRQNYFGKTYPPSFIFGAYSPSNEFRFWSEIPME